MSRPICYDLIDKVFHEVGRMKRKQEIIKMEAMEEELPGEYHTLAQLRR